MYLYEFLDQPFSCYYHARSCLKNDNHTITDLPTIKSSFSLAVGRIRLQRSIVKIVLALLNIEVRELMLADNMTAIKRPRTPAGGRRKQFLTCYFFLRLQAKSVLSST